MTASAFRLRLVPPSADADAVPVTPADAGKDAEAIESWRIWFARAHDAWERREALRLSEDSD